MVDRSRLQTTKIWSPELMKGKVAFITGGSNRGMISEIAKAYLQHGATAVALMARKAEKLAEVVAELNAASPGGKAIAVPGDVRKSDGCADAVKSVVDQFGRIDVLVNGAAGNFLASASKLSTNGFRTVMEIDTLGTFNMSRECFNQSFSKHGGGVIINISAELHWNGSALQAHSAAAKAGVDALTKVMACEWGPHKVRVCGLVPGAIAGTEGMSRLSDISTMNDREASKSVHAKNE